MVKRRIAILGSTGSIGRQALEVVREHPEHFEAEVLTANDNADLLIEQAMEFNPNAVVIANEALYLKVKEALEHLHIKVFAGEDALASIVGMETIDMVLAAIVGFAGLKSTLHAIENRKQLALANKESLVVAGDLITALAREKAVNIYPVDSEHSAIFQCLAGEFHNPVEKIYLTASGGPFYGWSHPDLEKVSPGQALNHPNWTMGNKITIDSATLMNKGLEVIEARWLFGLKPDQIEVIVHPQSIIHSMVQFSDGAVKAQMGVPDMKLPIQYAFSYPARLRADTPRIDFGLHHGLTFGKPDTDTFRCLALAYHALITGGNMPCAMNAANEVAVDAFLKGQLGFNKIPVVIEQTMLKIGFIGKPGINEYADTDREARLVAADLIKTKI